jgi:hypothetical protein
MGIFTRERDWERGEGGEIRHVPMEGEREEKATRLEMRKYNELGGAAYLSGCGHTYPGVLPLVGHRDDVLIKEMSPISRSITPSQPLLRRRGALGIPFQPRLYDVMIELLRPQQTWKERRKKERRRRAMNIGL